MVTREQPKLNLWVIGISIGVALGIVYFLFRPAFAWTYGVSGSAVCEKDGWKVSWVVDNTAEEEPLHVLTSDRDAVPAPVDVPAESSSTFTETVVGNDPVTLNLTGNFDGDEQIRERSATVEFEGDCIPEKPEEPPEVVVPPEIKALPATGLKE